MTDEPTAPPGIVRAISPAVQRADTSPPQLAIVRPEEVTNYCKLIQILKVKGLDIYIPPLSGKPEQQQFTSYNSKWRILTGISGR